VEEGYRYASGKDIAILKVEGLKNLPTVILGDSDRMEVGDKVIVIGYPYLVKSDAAGMVILSPETDLLPTVTSGIISAKRKSPDGSEVFQIDAPIQHGNSGGPAFNDKGEVIGIATWGSFMELPTSEGYSESELYNFLVPIDVAKSFINQLNINTVPSATIRRFENGLDYYWMGQYSQAEKEFNGILATNPNNYYAAEYLQMVNQRSS
jgi:serine protease Do